VMPLGALSCIMAGSVMPLGALGVLSCIMAGSVMPLGALSCIMR